MGRSFRNGDTSSDAFEKSYNDLNSEDRIKIDIYRDQVQDCIDDENKRLELGFREEDKLRKWIRDLVPEKMLNITDAEELLSMSRELPRGSIFEFSGVYLILTSTGHIDRVGKYIYNLETLVIENLNKSSIPELGFLDLIKLAFKKLFKGEL